MRLAAITLALAALALPAPAAAAPPARASVAALEAAASPPRASPAALKAASSPPRASLPDLEDEVMCVECGTPLSVSQSPVAERERALIRRDIAKGMTKEQIKAHLVDTYGEAVLADPGRSGFTAAVWLVPIAIVLLAAAAVALTARRWRRAPTPLPSVPSLDPEDARRLDAELGARDR